MTDTTLPREEVLKRARAIHDLSCKCPRQYLMSCNVMAEAVLQVGKEHKEEVEAEQASRRAPVSDPVRDFVRWLGMTGRCISAPGVMAVEFHPRDPVEADALVEAFRARNEVE